jgi:hypothetical protein
MRRGLEKQKYQKDYNLSARFFKPRRSRPKPFKHYSRSTSVSAGPR